MSPDELDNLSLVDMSCGSGVFLLGMFRRLLARLEAEHQGMSRLTLKHQILTRNIFGVDVDAEAVEVAKFNLMLAVIEGGGRRSLAGFGGKALPDLDSTIVCGNSLVGPDIYAANPSLPADSEVLRAINPFDFRDAFPAVFARGGFDAIVGNPPYVRIQTLAESQPLEMEFFQSSKGYRSAAAYNFDKYLLFIERSLDLLAAGGTLGYIIPHRFMNTLAGQAVRERLSSGQHVQEIVHFGLEQVFAGKTQTYTCLLVAGAEASADFSYEEVGNLADWRESRAPSIQRRYSASTLDGGAWSFVPDHTKEVFDRLRQRYVERLSDVAEIFVGVQTSADDVYFIEPTSITADELEFVDRTGTTHRIERAICRPALRDRRLKPYGDAPDPDAWAIFPYTVSDGTGTARRRADLIPPDEMAASFPLCWAYLDKNRTRLEARSVQSGTPDTWYRYGRSQSLAKLDDDKIIVRVLSIFPQYNRDEEGLLVPGGGDGGPYYLIRPLPGSAVTIPYLIGLLSHPVIDAMVWEAGGKEYRGGYFPHRKAFLKELPVPPEDSAVIADIDARVQDLMRIAADVDAELDPQLRLIHQRRFAAQQRVVETAVGTALALSDVDVSLVVGS